MGRLLLIFILTFSFSMTASAQFIGNAIRIPKLEFLPALIVHGISNLLRDDSNNLIKDDSGKYIQG